MQCVRVCVCVCVLASAWQLLTLSLDAAPLAAGAPPIETLDVRRSFSECQDPQLGAAPARPTQLQPVCGGDCSGAMQLAMLQPTRVQRVELQP